MQAKMRIFLIHLITFFSTHPKFALSLPFLNTNSLSNFNINDYFGNLLDKYLFCYKNQYRNSDWQLTNYGPRGSELDMKNYLNLEPDSFLLKPVKPKQQFPAAMRNMNYSRDLTLRAILDGP